MSCAPPGPCSCPAHLNNNIHLLKPKAMTKRILVVDDDISVLEVIEAALSYENFDVKTVGRTYNILKTIEEYKPDIILLDYLLDDINGGEYCHQIKTHPASKHLPVIIISAYPQVFESLGTYGCDSFIAKPFDLSTLVQTINTCLNKKQIDYV